MTRPVGVDGETSGDSVLAGRRKQKGGSVTRPGVLGCSDGDALNAMTQRSAKVREKSGKGTRAGRVLANLRGPSRLCVGVWDQACFTFCHFFVLADLRTASVT